MLDRSGSMRLNFDVVQQAAAQFVREMKPGDKARIGSFSNEVLIDPPDFTGEREALYKVLESGLQPEGPTPLWNAVDAAISALRDQDGRRVVLVFTDGVDKPLNFKRNNSTLKDVMNRAVRENIMVYAIGLAGQTGIPTFGTPGRSIGTVGGQPRLPGGNQGDGPRFEQPDEGLQKIAAETGGGYFELTGTANLMRTFSRVADELHHQYALGFTPFELDGKKHTLEVKVKGQKMFIRARQSYIASPERP
jgi:VWFA-related protein